MINYTNISAIDAEQVDVILEPDGGVLIVVSDDAGERAWNEKIRVHASNEGKALEVGIYRADADGMSRRLIGSATHHLGVTEARVKEVI